MSEAKYPGIPGVINGNAAVAHVMRHVCGGVIGYPITPSTEISEIYEAARAEGAVNVWGKHPFFFEPEGEHSAQSGALGAALTGGQFISNASSSQGILYALESHFVTVGKKIGGFVLQVAARVVSKHSLNVMAGHDDIYTLLTSGYTVLFGANPQEAADFAAISYRASALSLIPVANTMDGFATSHMLSEADLPEPELLLEYLGDPAGRIECPTEAQAMLFGAKGRVHALEQFIDRHADDFAPNNLAKLRYLIRTHADKVEACGNGDCIGETIDFVPESLKGQWRRQWLNAPQKGTRQMVPAFVDVNNPGMTGPVQNQPDFQAGAVDHRTHFVAAVPSLVRRAMDEYGDLTGRHYSPIQTVMCEDADVVMIGLGSVTEDVEAVLPHLRAQGIKAGLIAIKLLQPFPEAEVVAALAGKTAVTVLERSDQTMLTTFVVQALHKGRENADGVRHAGIPAIDASPRLTTAIFGLGGHDLQPRHLIAAVKNMTGENSAPLVYLGSQFYSQHPTPRLAEIQDRLRAAYPETALMALETEPNPRLLPDSALRIRFHSVGGYGTIATGKLLTDILAGVLDMHSKSAPKYGSEKSGAPTNYYITLSPEKVLVTNAELEDVEVVLSPDHKVFSHTDPLKGLVEGGTFILQTNLSATEVWAELPRRARRTIRQRHIKFLIVDAFSVAKRHAPTPELETRMMGIAFIGAVAAHVDRVAGGVSQDDILDRVRTQIAKKFGAKGSAVTEGNMAVIREGMRATSLVDYDAPEFVEIDQAPELVPLRTVALSASVAGGASCSGSSGLFDVDYYEEMVARPFREGEIGEAPVLPGSGLFMPAGTAAAKDKGLFRRTVPEFMAELCTGCMECALVCPDAAIPNRVHELRDLLLTAIKLIEVPEQDREALRDLVPALAHAVRDEYNARRDSRAFHELVADAVTGLSVDTLTRYVADLVAKLESFPVARTRPFFDAMERSMDGSGGLFSATIDPWKCTGCLECVDVCGPNALVARDQDAPLTAMLAERFEFMSRTPNTPGRFHVDATEAEGDTKRLFLDKGNYYATTGGHGGCRGCGEVTAIRMMMATNHAIGEKRRKRHTRELEQLVDQLSAKLFSLDDDEDERRERITGMLEVLERRLFLYESGPTGQGPSNTIVANATGCSSVYASTMPFNAYKDPWVNSLFQDAQPLAKGIFEGVSAQLVGDIRAIRQARLELEDAYDPAQDAPLKMLQWQSFSPDEMDLLPTVMTIGGDGASYDIGFGAMSRVLTSRTPIKIMVLNSGAYSNTGGQASTSSFTGQDSDLARHGVAHTGKEESRKELGILASFHPGAYVCSTTTAMQAHFLKCAMDFLTYTDGSSVMDVYTPCQSEQGIGDALANRRARLAVESRMSPLFVHDPRTGSNLHEWFSLDGNPDLDKPWSTTAVEYVDASGSVCLLETTLTPADFALGETRFKKQFRRLHAREVADAMTVAEYVELPVEERAGHTPFIYATDESRRLAKVAVSSVVIALVEERARHWRLLQYLSGQHVAELTAMHGSDVEGLRALYDEAMAERESSLDDLARAMSDLASSAGGSASSASLSFQRPVMATSGAVAPQSASVATMTRGPVYLSPADVSKCTDCKSCYQELPELFEKVRVVVDGEARTAARMIPGALEKITVTPDLERRIAKAKANCDAEILL